MTPIQARQLLDDLFVFETSSVADLSEKVAKELLTITKDAYYNSASPMITDAQFDSLEQYVATKFPSLSPQANVGAVPRGRTHKLPIKMGGLIQVYNGSQLESWRTNGDVFVVSDKLDGNSVLLHYEDGKFVSAFTRGDGLVGKDITRHVQLINFPKQIPVSGVVDIRCEGIIAIDTFDEVVAKSKAYKNARNTVAGVFNALEPKAEILPLFHLVAYQLIGGDPIQINKQEELKKLEKFGFNVVRYDVVSRADINTDTLTNMLNLAKSASRYELDGVVIDIDSAEQRAKMRSSSLDPEYARKFKINAESVESTVVDVEWTISKDGYLKPTIIVEPVDLLGVTIRRATGHNARNICELMICPGARVEIMRQGDVIPGINSVIEQSTEVEDYNQWFESSLNEVADEWVWNDTGVDVILADSDNDSVRLRMMIHVLTMLEIDQMREGNVIKMFDNGFETFEQLLDADSGDFIEAMGSNGTIAYMSFAKKIQNISIEELMVASGLFGRGMGRKKLRKALEAVDGEFQQLKNINIASIEGFQDKTASKVVNALDQFTAFYYRVSDKITLAPFRTDIDGKFSGQVVVFTGFRDSSLKATLIELGAQVVDSYSKKVTLVIAKDPNEGSTKLKKARENGAKIIGLDEIEEMIG